jgi:O-antigen/teichoic acid export membrane protein
LRLGLKFFIIQIAAIVFYQTNNIIISQLFGPAEVTSFNIAFQYLSIGTFAFMTILTPFWSAFTDAFTKGETEWIKKVMKNLKLIWVGLFFIFIILFFLSDFFIKLWVGKMIVVNKSLYIVIGIYLLINALNGIYSNFMNGVGKIMIQFYTALSLAIFHIPLAIFFGKKFGIMGTMFSLIIFGIIQIVLFEKQYRKIINYTDTGVWSK